MKNILNHLNIPSPTTEVQTNWSRSAKIKLVIKRDDLIHPFISGNKWRKLSGILAHYSSMQYGGIVTYGGAYSNHLLATAVTSSILQIPSIGIVRGEKPRTKNNVLKLCEGYGMQLKFISRDEYKYTNRQEGVVDNQLFIPEGGACKLGLVGCEEIVNEMALKGIDKIFVACGTGTTIAGMANAMLQKGCNVDMLHGIQVLKGKDYIKTELQENFGIQNMPIYDAFHCGGYAKTNDKLIHFIKDFTRETGVLLDPIYTGKLMLAVKKLCENGTIKAGEKIVAIHTGGLTGWFGKADLL